jgi:hypothetical protein
MTSTRSDIVFDNTTSKAISALTEIQNYLEYELDLIQASLEGLNSFNIDTESVLDKVSTLVHDLSDLNGRQNTEFTHALAVAFKNVLHLENFWEDESNWEGLSAKQYLGSQDLYS